MQLSISCILGQSWALETYRDELASRGWIYTFDISRHPQNGYSWPLQPLNEAIVAIDAWETFDYLPHAAADDVLKMVTLRFRSEDDALWAKLILLG